MIVRGVLRMCIYFFMNTAIPCRDFHTVDYTNVLYAGKEMNKASRWKHKYTLLWLEENGKDGWKTCVLVFLFQSFIVRGKNEYIKQLLRVA